MRIIFTCLYPLSQSFWICSKALRSHMMLSKTEPFLKSSHMDETVWQNIFWNRVTLWTKRSRRCSKVWVHVPQAHNQLVLRIHWWSTAAGCGWWFQPSSHGASGRVAPGHRYGSSATAESLEDAPELLYSNGPHVTTAWVCSQTTLNCTGSWFTYRSLGLLKLVY